MKYIVILILAIAGCGDHTDCITYSSTSCNDYRCYSENSKSCYNYDSYH